MDYLYYPAGFTNETIATLIVMILAAALAAYGIFGLIVREIKILFKIRTRIRITIEHDTIYWCLDIKQYPNYIPGLTDWCVVIPKGVTVAQTAVTKKPAMDFRALIKGDSILVINNGTMQMDPDKLAALTNVQIDNIKDGTHA